MLVADIYHKNVETVTAATTIGDALSRILNENVNGLIVVDNNKLPIGVISLQDIAAATVPEQFKRNVAMALALYKKGYFHEVCLALKEMPVSKVMRTEFIKVNLETNIMAITADFLNNDLYIVPVVDKDQLIGVITRTEIKKAIAIGMGLINDDNATDI